jgi:hypothetical protein
MISAVMGSAALVGMTGAIAQTPSSNLDPLEGLGTDSTAEGESLFGSTNGPFDIIHRAILAPTMSSQEYQKYQQELIGDEAEAFRLRQQEALRQSQETNVVEPEGALDGSTL